MSGYLHVNWKNKEQPFHEIFSIQKTRYRMIGENTLHRTQYILQDTNIFSGSADDLYKNCATLIMLKEKVKEIHQKAGKNSFFLIKLIDFIFRHIFFMPFVNRQLARKETELLDHFFKTDPDKFIFLLEKKINTSPNQKNELLQKYSLKAVQTANEKVIDFLSEQPFQPNRKYMNLIVRYLLKYSDYEFAKKVYLSLLKSGSTIQTLFYTNNDCQAAIVKQAEVKEDAGFLKVLLSVAPLQNLMRFYKPEHLFKCSPIPTVILKNFKDKGFDIHTKWAGKTALEYTLALPSIDKNDPKFEKKFLRKKELITYLVEEGAFRDTLNKTPTYVHISEDPKNDTFLRDKGITCESSQPVIVIFYIENETSPEEKHTVYGNP